MGEQGAGKSERERMRDDVWMELRSATEAKRAGGSKTRWSSETREREGEGVLIANNSVQRTFPPFLHPGSTDVHGRLILERSEFTHHVHTQRV